LHRLADGELVFRNEEGRPYTRKRMSQVVYRLRQRTGLPEHCLLSAVSALFARTALERGLPLRTVTQLLGQGNESLLERIYPHVEDAVEEFRQAAQMAVGMKPVSDVALGKPLPRVGPMGA
jgi:site-specific recombinase XerD